jgi:putative intracellular protease/amidase
MATGVLNGLYEVFSFVGTGWELLTGWPTGPRRFLPRIVAADRTPFRNLAALPIAPDLAFAEAKRADVVIVGDLAVGRDEETRGRWPAEVAWLRQQQAQGALICSVCTGALMLAEAGLLDGEEATCHWAAVDQLRLRYPEVRLRPERVLVPAGVEHRLVTAGAAASWTDLALYLRDHSPPDAVVAAADIGYLAFYSERRVLDLGGLVEPETGKLREAHEYDEIVERGLYFDVPGYPRVDYFVDRDHEENRFDGAIVNGHRFEKVHATVVRNLGIRKPGVYHYALYRLTPRRDQFRYPHTMSTADPHAGQPVLRRGPSLDEARLAGVGLRVQHVNPRRA